MTDLSNIGGADSNPTALAGSSAGGVSTGASSGTEMNSVESLLEYCNPDWGIEPPNVSEWINESWDATLGNDIHYRHAWLLDSVMKGNGTLNICVRWGATTAPSAKVKANVGAAASRWFNDWFRQLSGYGCFPYNEIKVAVTGWAVRPENLSWVSDLDSSIAVYTETDEEGEPTCPVSCGFLFNNSHTFPNCAGGDVHHYDYFIWLNDTLEEGIAALGGDWGLLMPAQSFELAMGRSDPVIEHEIGHGFGFADYYEWEDAMPENGSLMIIGSSASEVPTVADRWLLRRTWREMVEIRGW